MNRPFDQETVREAVTTWWHSLKHDAAARAYLRRIESPARWLDQIPGTPGEVRARNSFERLETNVDLPELDRASLAALAGLLANVKANAPTTAQSLAECFVDAEKGSILSERRFERLLSYVDRPLPYEELRRILQQFDEAPVGWLAGEIYHWGRETCERWASIYYEQLLRDDHATGDDETPDSFVRRWWKTLRDDHSDERAALQRCATPREARLLKGYHRLCAIAPVKKRNDLRLCLIAATLAHVRHDLQRENKSVTLGEIAGSSERRMNGLREHSEVARQNAPGERSLVHESRLERLLRASELADAYRSLIRLLGQVGYVADVQQLAHDLIRWGPDKRRSWAEAYYTVSLPPLRDDSEAEAS